MQISNKFIVILSIILLILFSFLVLTIISDSGKCIKNPLVYASEKIEQKENAELYCRCTLLGNEVKSFEFNNKGIINNKEEYFNLTI